MTCFFERVQYADQASETLNFLRRKEQVTNLNLCLTGCSCQVGFDAQVGIKQKRNTMPKTFMQVLPCIDHRLEYSPQQPTASLGNVDRAMSVERAENLVQPCETSCPVLVPML